MTDKTHISLAYLYKMHAKFDEFPFLSFKDDRGKRNVTDGKASREKTVYPTIPLKLGFTGYCHVFILSLSFQPLFWANHYPLYIYTSAAIYLFEP